MYNVIVVEGRENPSGQKAECLVGIGLKIKLDTSKIIGAIPFNGIAYDAEIQFVAYRDSTAFVEGKPHDPSSMQILHVNVMDDLELSTLFSQAFTALASKACLQLGGTMEQVNI